jgi:hypothetical protein
LPQAVQRDAEIVERLWIIGTLRERGTQLLGGRPMAAEMAEDHAEIAPEPRHVTDRQRLADQLRAAAGIAAGIGDDPEQVQGLRVMRIHREHGLQSLHRGRQVAAAIEITGPRQGRVRRRQRVSQAYSQGVRSPAAGSG